MFQFVQPGFSSLQFFEPPDNSNGRLGSVLADTQIVICLFITEEIDIISQYWLDQLRELR